MIQFGTLSHPFGAQTGAGPIRLMECYGWDSWGWETITNGQTITVPISLTVRSDYPAPADWQVALWWPETATQTHNRIGLYLRNPANTTTLASSINTTSVFQRAKASGTLAFGTYNVRITGLSVTGSQLVFYSSRARKSSECL